jgi:two-component system phosphate regulon response regulator PhoB
VDTTCRGLTVANILVIEDDPSVLLLLQYTLAAEGHEVETIERGDEALARLDRDPPDVVLTDIMIPGGASGLDVLRELRARDAWATVPVVVLSALSGDHNVWDGWQSGATSYLIKPYETDELLEVINEQLEAAAVPPPVLDGRHVMLPVESS